MRQRQIPSIGDHMIEVYEGTPLVTTVQFRVPKYTGVLTDPDDVFLKYFVPNSGEEVAITYPGGGLITRVSEGTYQATIPTDGSVLAPSDPMDGYATWEGTGAAAIVESQPFTIKPRPTPSFVP